MKLEVHEIKNNKVNMIFIGDVHFGISTTPRLYDELMAIVPKTIEEKKANIVFFAGDYFDKEIMGSHKYYATKFFAEIAKICEQRGIALRMIRGTKSHDVNQLTGLFGATNILLPDLDFKIINSVEEERLFGLDILYIPEEEVLNQDEYYAPYRSKKYNLIVGHGTWDYVDRSSFLLSNNDHEKLASPVFLTKDWDDTLERGVCVFGHIHNGPSYKNKYFYTRCFSRWKYGEEDAKGFLAIEMDNETFDYEVEYINNEMAPRYETINLSTFLEGGFHDNSVIEIRKKLREVANTNKEGRFRINVTNLSPTEIILLQKAASTIDNVDLQIESVSTEELLRESADEDDIQDYVIHPEKYEMTEQDVIIRFIKEMSGKDISHEDLRESLSEGDGS